MRCGLCRIPKPVLVLALAWACGSLLPQVRAAEAETTERNAETAETAARGDKAQPEEAEGAAAANQRALYEKIRGLTTAEQAEDMSPAECEALLEQIRGMLGASTPAKETEEPKERESGSVLDEYAELAAAYGGIDDEDKEILYYRCRHVSSATMKRVLDSFITSSGTVASSEESDIVVVWDLKRNIQQLREIAENVDQPVPQVLVQAQIVELTLDSDFEKELRLHFEHTSPSQLSFVKNLLVALSTPGAQATTGEGASGTLRPYVRNYRDGKRNQLATFLRYLETNGKAEILSAPNLILRRGSEGSIVTGQDVPIQEKTVTSGTTSISTTFKRVGIKLKVEPLMIRDDTVRLRVNPEVSTVTGFSNENPIIALRNATTELELKDGELLSMGGLLRSEKRTVRKRVPVASAIPILGHFFRATRVEEVKTHLVIFLTLRILKEGKRNGTRIHRPQDLPPAVHEEMDALREAEREAKPRAQILRDLDRFLDESEE